MLYWILFPALEQQRLWLQKNNRVWIGIDANEQYCELATERMKQETEEQEPTDGDNNDKQD